MSLRIIFALILLCNGQFLQAQNFDLSTFKRIDPVIDVEKGRKYKDRKLLPVVDKGNIRITFQERFEDSIYTFIDGKIFRSDFVISDSIDLGMSNVSFVVSLGKKRKKKVLLVLPQKKIYIKFFLTHKYQLVKVFRNVNNWRVRRTNYIPIYK